MQLPLPKDQAAQTTRRTRISFSRLRVCAISYADCIRISVCLFTPKEATKPKGLPLGRP
jgi:hypothetical protein